LREKVLVVKAPPCGGVAAEALALVLGIGTWTRAHVDDPYLEDVARLGLAHRHGPGADVDTEALARSASKQRGLHRSGAAPVDALLLLVPVEDALGAGITLDHPIEVVVGVMREHLEGHEIPGADLDLWLQQLAEVAPVHGLVGGGHVVVISR